MQKKGQLTIVGIILIFVSVIVFASIYPALSEVITSFTNSSGDTMLNILVNLVPAFICLGIIITLFMYVSPYRPEG